MMSLTHILYAFLQGHSVNCLGPGGHSKPHGRSFGKQVNKAELAYYRATTVLGSVTTALNMICCKLKHICDFNPFSTVAVHANVAQTSGKTL